MYYGAICYAQYFPHVVVVTTTTTTRGKGAGGVAPQGKREPTRNEFIHRQRQRETEMAAVIAADDTEMFDIIERMWKEMNN